jgi:hypothetical protein
MIQPRAGGSAALILTVVVLLQKRERTLAMGVTKRFLRSPQHPQKKKQIGMHYIAKRASATAASLQGRLRKNNRRGGGEGKARKRPGCGRVTSASPSHKTRAAHGVRNAE